MGEVKKNQRITSHEELEVYQEASSPEGDRCRDKGLRADEVFSNETGALMALLCRRLGILPRMLGSRRCIYRYSGISAQR